MATVKAVELIVSGKVQRVGYREFVAGIAQEFGLVGFAENLKDGTVRIRCKGGVALVDKFKEAIDVKNPPEVPLIDVKRITEKQLKEMDVAETVFEERYGDPNVELLQAVSTGTKYIGHLSKKIDNLGIELGGKIDSLSVETKSGFNKMDKNFETLGNKLDAGFNKTNERLDAGFGKMDKNFERLEGKTEQFRTDSNTNFQVLGGKYGKISTTMERIDKNIEKIATKKKGIF